MRTSRSGQRLKVVIFDVSKTVIDDDGGAVRGIADAIAALGRAGVKIAFAANESEAKAERVLRRAGIDWDLIVGQDTAQARKPSPRFCSIPADTFGAEPHEMIYVGDNDSTDALCAVNARVLYLAALWANPNPKYGMPVQNPDALLRFVFRFLMEQPRWYWKLDRRDSLRRHVHVRGLLPATRQSVELKNVLKFERDLRVEGLDYWSFLFRRLVTALMIDGLLSDIDTWTWYPSASGAPKRRRFTKSFDTASRTFRDYHVPDLLVRHREAIKSATARARGSPPTFANQVSTVHLNPDYETRVREKHVLVADDFCTAGYSFEWARNMLFAAGARDVTCVAFGRYWDEYRVQVPKKGRVI